MAVWRWVGEAVIWQQEDLHSAHPDCFYWQGWTPYPLSNCACEWNGLFLRVQKMSKGRWAWAIYDGETEDETPLACSSETYVSTSSVAGILAQQEAAKLFKSRSS